LIFVAYYSQHFTKLSQVNESNQLWHFYYVERWGRNAEAVYDWKVTYCIRHKLEREERLEREKIEREKMIALGIQENFNKSAAFIQDLEDDELCIEEEDEEDVWAFHE